jgi:hypothetical protein
MDTQNNNATANADTGVDTGAGSSDGIDANIEKHLNIAIEAQDGKTEEKKPDEEGANTKTEKKPEAGAEAGKEKQSSDSQSITGDTTAKDKPTEEGKEKRPVAGAKDLTLQDGTVVKGGAERRFYEQREAARHELQVTKNELAQLRNQFKERDTEFKALKEATENLHGIEPKILAVGAKIVKDLQSDPVGTLKKLLAETAAQGYDVKDLGVGIDTAAISRMIDERIPKNEQKAPTEQEIIAESEKEVQQFFSKFPDAKPHDALIAKVLRDHPEESLTSVYFTLKNAFAEQGYDWSIPLEQQLESDPQNKGAKSDKTEDGKAPLPQGGGNGNAEFKLNDKASASEDMDTGDIVRAAMKEAGYNV